jgi:hypothetical protein
MSRQKPKTRKVKAVWGPDFKTDPMNPFYNPPSFPDSSSSTPSDTTKATRRISMGQLKVRYRTTTAEDGE